MAHLEVFSALAPHARYAVASQETEPALGWAYTSFLDALRQNPDMSGADLSRFIVDSYIQDDQRILDDQARAELMGAGRSFGGLFDVLSVPTAAQVTRQMEQSITLTAIDLTTLPSADRRRERSGLCAAKRRPEGCRPRRAATPSPLRASLGVDVPPSYIDLGHFCAVAGREQLGRRREARRLQACLTR